MNTFKKLTALLLCACLTIGFLGCTNTNINGNNGTQTNVPETKEPVLQVETDEPTANPIQTPDQTEETQLQNPTAEPDTTVEPNPTTEPDTTNQPSIQTINKNEDFYMSVAQYMLNNGYADKSFIVSPTSFRAALCLAIAGADGETKDELLHAAGFETMGEVNEWYNELLDSVRDFNYVANEMSSEYGTPDIQFSLANAVWSNSNISQGFLDSYKEYIKKYYNAEANVSSADTITDDVNSWADKNTNGMIKRVVDDLSTSSSALANALYLKSAWALPFNESMTEDRTFHCADGSEVDIPFMNQTESFLYYGDDESQILVLPLYGNKQLILVLGNSDRVMEKISLASYQRVSVSIPKMDISSDFNNGELERYLMSLGAEQAFNPMLANFKNMCQPDEEWYIDDIVQVAKIKTDENGLEAAAVTVISVKSAGFVIDPTEPIYFVADHSFMFFVTSNLGETNQEILFIGQMAEAK